MAFTLAVFVLNRPQLSKCTSRFILGKSHCFTLFPYKAFKNDLISNPSMGDMWDNGV